MLRNRKTYDVFLELMTLAGYAAILIWFGVPTETRRVSMFIIALGAYTALCQFLVMKGRPMSKYQLSSEEQKVRMLFGGIIFIVLGLLILLI